MESDTGESPVPSRPNLCVVGIRDDHFLLDPFRVILFRLDRKRRRRPHIQLGTVRRYRVTDACEKIVGRTPTPTLQTLVSTPVQDRTPLPHLPSHTEDWVDKILKKGLLRLSDKH